MLVGTLYFISQEPSAPNSPPCPASSPSLSPSDDGFNFGDPHPINPARFFLKRRYGKNIWISKAAFNKECREREKAAKAKASAKNKPKIPRHPKAPKGIHIKHHPWQLYSKEEQARRPYFYQHHHHFRERNPGTLCDLTFAEWVAVMRRHKHKCSCCHKPHERLVIVPMNEDFPSITAGEVKPMCWRCRKRDLKAKGFEVGRVDANKRDLLEALGID